MYPRALPNLVSSRMVGYASRKFHPEHTLSHQEEIIEEIVRMLDIVDNVVIYLNS